MKCIYDIDISITINIRIPRNEVSGSKNTLQSPGGVVGVGVGVSTGVGVGVSPEPARAATSVALIALIDPPPDGLATLADTLPGPELVKSTLLY